MSKSTQRWAINSTHWQPGESEFQFLLSLLPAQEANACVTYVKKADQKRALLSRLLQRAACCSALDVSFVDVVIKRTKGNKPFFCGDADKQDAPNYNFNVSHEGDYVVLASEPVCLCGVDVSAPNQIRREPGIPLQAVMSAFQDQMTMLEWEVINNSQDEIEMEHKFRRLWSLKEAFVKARGDGVGFPFKECEFHLPDGCQGQHSILYIGGVAQNRWRFWSQELSGGHWVSVARGPPDAAVDAHKNFTATFQKPEIETDMLRTYLDAPNPLFKELFITDVIPHGAQSQYKAALS